MQDICCPLVTCGCGVGGVINLGMNTSRSTVVSSLCHTQVQVCAEMATERAPLPGHSLRLVVKVALSRSNQGASSLDVERSHRIESELLDLVQKRIGGVYSGWVLASRTIDFQFFLPSTLEAQMDDLIQLVEGVLAQQGALFTPVVKTVADASVSVGVDKAVSAHTPSAPVERIIEHRIFFTTYTRASLAMRDLLDAGFFADAPAQCRVVDDGHPKGENRWVLHVRRAEPMTRTSVMDFTRTVRGLIAAYSGEYDGWTEVRRTILRANILGASETLSTRARVA